MNTWMPIVLLVLFTVVMLFAVYLAGKLQRSNARRDPPER